MITPPTWLDRSEYPFASNTFGHRDGRMHYVDEGRGPVLLFVHGTPDWSFGFRHLIKAFKDTHRCVAADLLGFGLGDKPAGADYSVAAHARRLRDFIDHLALKNVTLVVTDFGGGIGLQHALEHAENVKGIVLYNTWMWALNDDKRFAGPSKMMSGAIGRFLYLRMGASVKMMMPMAYGDKKKLTKTIHAQYKQVFPNAASRLSTHALVKELMNAGPFWEAQWAKVDRLRDLPALLCWGMKDKLIPPDFLEPWKGALPNASVVSFPEVGHFLHEEAPDGLINAIREFNTKAERFFAPSVDRHS